MPIRIGGAREGSRVAPDHRLPSRNASYQKRSRQLAAAQRRIAREADHLRRAGRASQMVLET
jgi:hypothetical protein